MAQKASKKVPAKKAVAPAQPAGRIYFKQSDFPLVSLQQAQKIASAIMDNFAGDGGSPPDIALLSALVPPAAPGKHLQEPRSLTASHLVV